MKYNYGILNFQIFKEEPFLVSFRSGDLLLSSLGSGKEIVNDILYKISWQAKLSNYKYVFIYLHDLNTYGSIILNFFKSDLGFIISDSIVMHNNIIYGFKIRLINTQITLVFKCSFMLTSLSFEEFLRTMLPDFNILDISTILNTCEFFSIFQKNVILCNSTKTLGIINKYTKISSQGDSFCFDLREFLYNYTYTLSLNFWSVLSMFFNEVQTMFNLNLSIRTDIYTLSSLSFVVYMKNFNDKNIYLGSDFPDIRCSYYGGRVEVYGNPIYDNKIFYYDFSKFYSSIMQTENMPISKPIYVKDVSGIIGPGFYFVDVYSDLTLPVLPFFCKKLNKLIFPNGNFSGWYWFEELNLFLKQGGVIKSYRGAYIYDKYVNCFDTYINYLREFEGKTNLMSIIIKRLVNSLYGKLGLKSEDLVYSFFKKSRYNSIMVNNKLPLKKKIVKNTIDFLYNKDYLLLVLDKNNDNSLFGFSKYDINQYDKICNISIASAIASKGRVKLYLLMDTILKNNGRLLYVDTDSVFVEFQKTATDHNIGCVNWLHKYCDAIFIEPKSYFLYTEDFYTKSTVKGIDPSLLKNINFFDIKCRYFTESCFNMMFSTKELRFNKRYPTPKIISKMYFIENKSKKRVFSVDKKHSLPLVISSD